MRNSWRLWSVLLLFATGCTYNPVRYDPATGFQTGGGVGVLCGGPLDPWMLHCCPQSGCFGPCDCLRALFCGRCCPPACPPACPTACPPAYPTPVCAPACPTPVCAPAYPAPVCAPACPTACPPTYSMPGIPLGSGVSPYSPLPMVPGGSPVLSAPMAAPQVYGAPTPTFAEPCATCATSPSASAYYQPNVQGMLPATMNYPQLFNSPPMAPPPPAPADGFMMPTPMNENEMPPAADKMPPHYEEMETPGRGQPMPRNAAPMNQTTPLPMITPRKAPEQNPMPAPANINQSSFRQVMPSSISHQGVIQPALKHYDSRRQQWIPIRL